MSAPMMYSVVHFSDQGKAESQQSIIVPSSLPLLLTLSDQHLPVCQAFVSGLG